MLRKKITMLIAILLIAFIVLLYFTNPLLGFSISLGVSLIMDIIGILIVIVTFKPKK